MAKLEQGILGPFRGKVGTVVGFLWRGRHVVRAYRKEITSPILMFCFSTIIRYFVEQISVLTSTSNTLAISVNCESDGW